MYSHITKEVMFSSLDEISSQWVGNLATTVLGLLRQAYPQTQHDPFEKNRLNLDGKDTLL